jgi:lipopolysaccharide/colanic/teichoic acid biosynthesis glycosyltransferase
LKRLGDFILAGLSLVILSPFLVSLAVLVQIFLGSPVFFRQERSGLEGKTFVMIKFRTMTNRTDTSGALLPDSERLTRFGRFLRSTSLDELPELWNVVRGEMSFVGPRPLLVEYLPLYSKHQERRHEVRPGITGLAQVKGRNQLSWLEKFELDIWYIDNRTFSLDCSILFWTMKSVLARDGIDAVGSSTVSRFEGT